MLYPGFDDLMLSYNIDIVLDLVEDQIKDFVFYIFKQWGTEEFDAVFIPFITDKLPKFLTKVEAILTEKGKKFLLTDYITLADIHLGWLFFQLIYNEDLEYCHIMQAVVEQYPKTLTWIQLLLAEFKTWRSSYKLKVSPKPTLAYWNCRGNVAAMRY